MGLIAIRVRRSSLRKARASSIAHRQACRLHRSVFRHLNDELADKGFLVTATDDIITWARTGSLIG